MEKVIAYLLTEHRGKTIGVSLGLLASILFISFGFWRTLLIFFCILAGYYIGRMIDDNTDMEIWIRNLFKPPK